MHTPTFRLGWVRASIMERYKGLTPAMLDKGKYNGDFEEDKHWRRDRRNRIWWNFEAIEEWVENGF